ncbi:hypothetical protein, partial [Sphingobium sp. MK2]|uniref:hypothetical protein n=1 Tax=Sphingobium sp. MK2 TaxID=3116540 RepID=UPI0032E36716
RSSRPRRQCRRPPIQANYAAVMNKPGYSRISEAAKPALAEKELAILASMEVANFRKATRRRIEAYHARKIANQWKIIQDSAEH